MQFLRHAIKLINLREMSYYYAVARGRKVGIYDSWSQCEDQIKGFKGARYKKFPTQDEAKLFINSINSSVTLPVISFSPKDVAIALGKKTAEAQWNKSTEAETPKILQTETKVSTDLWPDSDGDSFDEDVLNDAELIAALDELDEKNNKTSSSTKQSHNRLKRSLQMNKDASNSKSKVPKHASKVWEPVGQECIGGYDFFVDVEDFVIVYTDGSCINNGQQNASAGFGVYFGDDHPLNASKPVKGRVTNNVGEIQAAIHAIKIAKDVGIEKLCISTDSQFLINAITAWICAWKRNKWCLKNGEPVKNKIDFMELDAQLRHDTLAVKWNYVKAHKGIKGNEMADKLARLGSDIYKRLHAK